jgi:hypothetical protein
MLQFRRSKSNAEAALPAPADLATGFAPVGSMRALRSKEFRTASATNEIRSE